MTWMPVVTLPNIAVQCRVEGRYAAIVNYYDRRLSHLRGQHPKLKRFLNGFRDAFGRIHRPSVLMLHAEKYDTYRQSEAIAAFRDLLAISAVPYARASVLKYGKTSFEAVYANAFGFYPWMIDVHYDGLIASTPAMLASDETERFSGRVSPEIGYYPVSEVDEPLLRALIDRWEARFENTSPPWRDRALFRSLNMAYHAGANTISHGGHAV